MKTKIWMALALLLLASLACSLGRAAEKAVEVGEDAATQVAEATAEVDTDAEATPTEEVSGEGAPSPEVDADALSGLASYRVRMEMQWTPEGGEPEGMVMSQEHTQEPMARRFVMDAGEEETFEWVQIGDQAWYCFGETCAQSEASEEDIVSNFGEGMTFDPASVTEGSGFRYVDQETVNGIRTNHYVLDLTAAEAALLAEGDVSNVEGETWIAGEADLSSFVVRFTMSWKETREGQAGLSELSYEVYDVNKPITIEPPEAAAGTGLPEDVPTYPNAAELTTMGGVATFSTPDDVTTVADFYRTELANQGWTNQSDDEMGEMISQAWQKESRELMLMISAEEEGSSVVITIE